MLNKLDSHSSLPNIQEIATNFRLIGWINFGLQLSLLVVSGLIVLFAIADPNFNLKAQDPMSWLGLFCAVGGLLILGISLYWDWRYTRIGKELHSANPALHPKKADVIRLLWRGLTLNGVGMILTLFGVEAIVGTLVARSLTQVEGLAIYNASQLIEPLDMFVVQANINTILAQFVGIISSAWLISRISYHHH
ncbi:hypothetical protein CEN50_01695 [Fischerella thermalis CCMEE 5268]|uniref:DUF3611 domain-containing protein n=1 Tax=Fischerella thermalis CCMEE 5268 TaxID=2019662 RepID=A0A2N6KLN8_9CYAN|nr:DUF3611 family protein [Fischerella thermalis]PMB00782.1 hypothetical protein CEN50_01695 [Fischerella thermalis CCMEE 5268]